MASYIDWASARQHERAACVALLDERMKDAQFILDHHKNDPVEVRSELAGYLRGLRDAQSAIRMRKD